MILCKNRQRLLWKQRRSKISSFRQTTASKNILSTFRKIIKSYRFVISYASFGDECDTWALNNFLAKKGKLVLPKVENKILRFFLVSHVSACLQKSPWGILEPISKKCQEVSCFLNSCVLVPALAFDKNLHRLGYGKGFYDRFLSNLSSKTKTIGIGFKEQLSPSPLPTSFTDVSLKNLLLF